MNWTTIDTWIVITAALVSVACILPGCFLFLSKQSMMSHGIAHAVLPGIVIGHLLSGEVETPVLLVGAVFAGVGCAVLTRFLQRQSGIDAGAALGISFTTLFALGLVMQRLLADKVHIEPSHVLYGNLEIAVFDSGLIPDVAIRAFMVVVVNALFVVLFYKELKHATFDESHSQTSGMRPDVFYYLIMTISAVTCVIAFEAVGSILVVAMMILPAAIANLLCKNLRSMILLSLLIGVLGSFLGHLVSIQLIGAISAKVFQLEEIGSTNTAAGITIVFGLIFTVTVLLQKLTVKATPKKDLN